MSLLHPKTSVLKAYTPDKRQVSLVDGTVLRVQISSDSDDYKTVQLASKFTAMEINQRGELVAVSNETEIHIVTISTLRVFSLPNMKLIRLRWHPLATHNATLCILSHDSVTLYDVLSNDSWSRSLSGAGMGLNSCLGSTVDFCFGSNTDVMGQMTAYFLTEDSDVYAMYPLLPRVIDESFRGKLNQLVHHCGAVSRDETTRDTVEQLRFVTKLAKNGVVDVVDLFSGIQGPFSIVPFLDSIYDTTATVFSSVTVSGVDLVVAGYQDGTVAVMFQDEPLTMMWDQEVEPSITMLAHTKVSPAIQEIVGKGDSLVVTTKTSTHTIDLPFCETLNRAITTGMPELVTGIKMECIVTNGEPVSVSRGTKETTLTTGRVPYKCLISGKYVAPRAMSKPMTVESAPLDKESVATVEQLQNVSKQAYERVLQQHKIAYSMLARLKLQRDELHNQVLHANELTQRAGCLSQVDSDKVRDRQLALNARLEAMANKLVTMNFPVNDMELDWFREIKATVYAFKSAQKEYESIKTKIDTLKVEPLDEWSALQETLNSVA